MKRLFTTRITCWIAALALSAPGTVPLRAAALDANGLEVIKVRDNFYMLAGAGGNIGVQIGSDGVVLANAGNAASADKVLATVKSITSLPIRAIFNLDSGPDFVGGNLTLGKAGLAIRTNSQVVEIIAPESVLTKMSARNANPSYPGDAWPNDAFLGKRHAVRLNDEGIEVWYQPAAHSNTDSVMLFRKSDVIVTGDIIDFTRFPVIDLANGGTIQGEIDALNKVIEMTISPIPLIYKDVGTYVIPGHGRLCEQMEVVDYRDMVVIVRDAVQDQMKQGKTLDQIKAAHPALAYETRYGTQPGATDNFIESIYKSLSAKK